MYSMYRFVDSVDKDKEVNTIATSEEAARIRSKLTDKHILLESFVLSSDWQV